MCIICLKPEGVDVPSDEEIRYMFRTNPDGAGYALQGKLDGQKFSLMFKKGFMDVESFIKSLRAEGTPEFLKSITIAMHFRIGTSGEKVPATTHPFIIADNYKDTCKTTGRNRPILFHNGVFTGLGGTIDEKASDTQDYVVGVAAKYLNKSPERISKIGAKIATIVAGSCRLLVMYPNQEKPYIKIGTWHEHGGCSYSNLNYYEPYNNKQYQSASDFWDDYDYWHGWGSYRSRRQRHTTTTTRYEKTLFDIDEFGRNIASWASPSPKTDWIKCESTKRFNQLLGNSKLIGTEEESGFDVVTFPYDPEELWYADPKGLQLVKESRLQDYIDFMDMELGYIQFGALPEDEIINFDSDEEIEQFCAMAQQSTASPYMFVWGKKTWLIDSVYYKAYTFKGLKEEFKTGALGHVIRYLKEEGTVYYHQQVFQHSTDDSQKITQEEINKIFTDNEKKLGTKIAGTLAESYQGA